ncbi:Serine/threonine protein kinase [Streptomyces sp. TLI_053]|uniref:serine/threonine-protein kinase n=1 Tax=Streptomyces sp. TLI_053 TaxID=1855352 RepID=UPI0008798BF4|nr:serine/threonine-protein kinase [Streptomyces sp. TLI_053]SDT80507.1 Serine/threonine protein kinase [Streptomyces sp. TLI_053]
MRGTEPGDPTRIGPYTLVGRLGAGGMGVVFLGRSAGGRTVAVKLVRPELAGDQGFRARFRHEVRAARAASSAFTAPVVDADPDGPLPWLATAFVPGVGLDEAARLVGAFPEHVLRILAAGIAEELRAIHAVGLTHRDLKPSNVLLALDGPHVIDFGIARAADGSVITAEGAIFGTPAYMSPEQALGRTATPASDVFSLGATLVHAASGGRGPFDGEPGGHPLALLNRVAHEEPDLSAVPEGLRLLVAACLAKDPAARPAPAQVLAAVARDGSPLGVRGPWLHPVLVERIEEAAAVLAPDAAATPPPMPLPEHPVDDRTVPLRPDAPPRPTLPLLPAAPPPTPPAGPSRRKLLWGLAGGAAALAGGGAALALGLPDGGGSGRGGGTPPGSSSSGVAAAPAAASGTPSATPSPTPSAAVTIGTDTVATPLWTGPVTEALVQVAGSEKAVLAVGKDNIWAFDLGGRPLWGPVPNRIDSTTTYLGGTTVALDGSRVYTATSGGRVGFDRLLRALDLGTGQEVWNTGELANLVQAFALPGMLDGSVFVTGLANVGANGDRSTGTVWAVDAQTGKVNWTARTPDEDWGRIKLMVPSSGRTLLWTRATLRGDAPRITGVDTQDGGRIRWNQPAPGVSTTASQATPALNALWYDGPHTSAGGRFLFLSDHLYALEPDTGQVAWQSADTTLHQAVVAAPDGATVYAAGFDTANLGMTLEVRAYDAATGRPGWTARMPREPTALKPPALHCADGNVYLYIGTTVYALDAATGATRWTFRFGGSPSGFGPVALWAGGGLLLGNTDQGLVAIPADGKPRG